jgi:hypothetical protein
VTPVGWPFMTRLSTRRIRREWSLATTNTMDRNSCWSHHGGRTWPSPSVPTSVLSICMTSVTPSQLNCRICLAPASSYRSPRRTNSRSSPLGGVAKNRNPRRDAALHEVRRFERPRAAGIERYDNNVGELNRPVNDERPSCGSQNWLPNRGNCNDCCRGQCDHDW